jgi:hypothetical protein
VCEIKFVATPIGESNRGDKFLVQNVTPIKQRAWTSSKVPEEVTPYIFTIIRGGGRLVKKDILRGPGDPGFPFACATIIRIQLINPRRAPRVPIVFIARPDPLISSAERFLNFHSRNVHSAVGGTTENPAVECV